MCGIVGLVTLKRKIDNTLESQFKESLQNINHRGPDNSSFIKSNNILFGHTRLSVLDLTDDSNQPMNFLDKYTLVFNGEIYNYIELKKELAGYGYEFKTKGDTEVILAAYDYWKESCVNYFNGMWAFAIYDKISKKVFCSRDRFGKKPLFYYKTSDLFVFASEIKAILPFVKDKKVNYRVVAPFITRGILDFGEETFFKEIYRLLPSHNLNIDIINNTLKTYQFYDIKKTDINISHTDIYNNLVESIRLRLRSDVKIGTCLSGGLDSSSITAIAHKYYGNNLIAIHAKSSIKENDESKYAEEVASHLGIDLHIVEPSGEDFWKSIKDVVYTQEEPFGSSSIFMQYFVMKKAKELGCTVMLDGQGADEVFIGYEHYLTYVYKELSKNGNFDHETFFNTIKLFRNNKENLLLSINKAESFDNTWDIIKNQGTIKDKYLDKKIFESILSFSSGIEFQKRAIYNKSLQALLRYEDRNAMSFGIETRLPFLDYNIVENVLNMPIEQKFNKGYLKYLLRKAMESSKLLPHNIVWRYNKMGFESPQSLWIDMYRQEMKDIINNSKIIKEFFYRLDIRRDDFLWRLFSLAIWEKVFDVKA